MNSGLRQTVHRILHYPHHRHHRRHRHHRHRHRYPHCFQCHLSLYPATPVHC